MGWGRSRAMSTRPSTASATVKPEPGAASARTAAARIKSRASRFGRAAKPRSRRRLVASTGAKAGPADAAPTTTAAKNSSLRESFFAWPDGEVPDWAKRRRPAASAGEAMSAQCEMAAARRRRAVEKACAAPFGRGDSMRLRARCSSRSQPTTARGAAAEQSSVACVTSTRRGANARREKSALSTATIFQSAHSQLSQRRYSSDS